MKKKVKSKYIVNVKVSYFKMEFLFDSSVSACNFMDTLLNHIEETDDGKELKVSMKRVDEEIKEEVE